MVAGKLFYLGLWLMLDMAIRTKKGSNNRSIGSMKNVS
jgi:hypothetical protein